MSEEMKIIRVPREMRVFVENDKEFFDWYYSRIIIPIRVYERFLALGEKEGKRSRWADAYVLYNHLFYTARRQRTNQVWANYVYCARGLKWTVVRFYRARDWLVENEFITILPRTHTKKGYADKVYIRVNISEYPVFGIQKTGETSYNSPTVTSPAFGFPEIGNHKVKCFNLKNKEEETPNVHKEIHWEEIEEVIRVLSNRYPDAWERACLTTEEVRAIVTRHSPEYLNRALYNFEIRLLNPDDPVRSPKVYFRTMLDKEDGGALWENPPEQLQLAR